MFESFDFNKKHTIPDLNIGTKKVKLSLVLRVTREQSSHKQATVITEACNYIWISFYI